MHSGEVADLDLPWGKGVDPDVFWRELAVNLESTVMRELKSSTALGVQLVDLGAPLRSGEVGLELHWREVADSRPTLA